MAQAGESFDGVFQLLDAGDSASTREAHRMLAALLDEQVTDRESMCVGQFSWGPGRGVGDLNVALFRFPLLLDIAVCHGDRLSTELGSRLDEAMRLALLAAERRWDEEIFDLHRDHKFYTNVFLLYIQALLLGGRHYADERLVRYGAAQWQRWFSHVAYYGVDEFATDYLDNVDFNALLRIREAAPNDRVRRQAELVLDHLAVVEHAFTHPRLKLRVCGSARDKRAMLEPGNLEGRWIDAGAGKAQPNRFAPGGGPIDYRPPEHIVEAYRNRRFPYNARGRATIVPYFYETWQDEQAALGSMTGGNYFWQQVHCAAVVGEDENRRAALCLPGSYTIANGYVRQKANRALCVFTRRTNTYLRTQRFATDAETPELFGDVGVGLSDGWRVVSDGARLRFTAYGHVVTLDPFVVEADALRPVELRLEQRTSLSQGRFHQRDIEIAEYCFPADAEVMGCLVQLTSDGQSAAPAALSCRRESERLRIAGDDLAIELHLQPAGGETELYDRDWRTEPIFRCPERTYWPGELAKPPE